MQENSERQIWREIKGGQSGKKVAEKMGEKVGKKTGEKVGKSLVEIHKLNLVPTPHLDATKGISQVKNSSLKGFIVSSEIIRTLTK